MADLVQGFGSDGMGIAAPVFYDMDNDGVLDTQIFDSNGDGITDTIYAELDTDRDGFVDTVIESHDYNQDGIFESADIYYDHNQDGIYETLIKGYDSTQDGLIDTYTTYLDDDGSGSADTIFREQYLDQNGDGLIDTYILETDANADHIFEAVEVYDIQENGLIEIPAIGENLGHIAGTYVEELGRFDPNCSDLDAVSGNPVEAMELWEFQGDTGRCALYSQKFVIEEITGQKIDIEEFANLAAENGWFDEASGTPLLNMNKMLDYYGINNKMTFHNSIADVEKCWESGGKVIVSIDADEIWYGESDDLFTPGDGPNHAVEWIGIDRTDPEAPMAILNDSGNPDGCGELVPLDVFQDAWDDGNCQMIACW